MCTPEHLLLNCNRIGESHTTCIRIDMQGCSGLYFPPWNYTDRPLWVRGGIVADDGVTVSEDSLHWVNVRKSIRIGVFLSDDAGVDRFTFDFCWCMVWMQKSDTETRTWFVLPGLPTQKPPPKGFRILFGTPSTTTTQPLLNLTTGEKHFDDDWTAPTEHLLPNVRARFSIACCGQHEDGNTQYFCPHQCYITLPTTTTDANDADAASSSRSSCVQQ
jgi:hypothetical protein